MVSCAHPEEERVSIRGEERLVFGFPGGAVIRQREGGRAEWCQACGSLRVWWHTANAGCWGGVAHAEDTRRYPTPPPAISSGRARPRRQQHHVHYARRHAVSEGTLGTVVKVDPELYAVVQVVWDGFPGRAMPTSIDNFDPVLS